MFRYLLLNMIFLAFSMAVLWLVGPKKISWKVIALPLAALMLLTAVFDNVIIASDIVRYHEAKLLGLFVFLAPIEDFAYTIAATILAVALWKGTTNEKT